MLVLEAGQACKIVTMCYHLPIVSYRVGTVLQTCQILLQKPWLVHWHLKLANVFLEHLYESAISNLTNLIIISSLGHAPWWVICRPHADDRQVSAKVWVNQRSLMVFPQLSQYSERFQNAQPGHDTRQDWTSPGNLMVVGGHFFVFNNLHQWGITMCQLLSQ